MAFSRPLSGSFTGRPQQEAAADQSRLQRVAGFFPMDMACTAVPAFLASNAFRVAQAALGDPARLIAELRVFLDHDPRIAAAAAALRASPDDAQADVPPGDRELEIETTAIREESVRRWVNLNLLAWKLLDHGEKLALDDERLLPAVGSPENNGWRQWLQNFEESRRVLLNTLAVSPADFDALHREFANRIRTRLLRDPASPLDLPDGLAVVAEGTAEGANFILRRRTAEGP